MFGSAAETRDNVKEIAKDTGQKVATATRTVRDYATEHKAVTVAGVVALGAIGLGIYALMKKNND